MWRETRVQARQQWADGLFTLQLEARLADFKAGQFLNLAAARSAAADDADAATPKKRVRRPYSIASAPGAPLEFYIVRVDDGALTPALDGLRPGDPLQYDDAALGFFTPDEVPATRDLWLIATGTGLAPYVAMVRSGVLWPRFDNVVVVHGVRLAEQLAYREELQHSHPHLRYQALTSRQECAEALSGRITSALADGRLEKSVGLTIDAAHSHVMLCGNPAMIADMRQDLAARGLAKHRRRKPGQVTMEKYW